MIGVFSTSSLLRTVGEVTSDGLWISDGNVCGPLLMASEAGRGLVDIVAMLQS